MANIACRRESTVDVTGCPGASFQEVVVLCTGSQVRDLLSVNILRPPGLWVFDALTAAGFGHLLPHAPSCQKPCATIPPERFDSTVRHRDGTVRITMRASYRCADGMGSSNADTQLVIEVMIEPPDNCPPSGADGTVVVTVTITGGKSASDKAQESYAKGAATSAARSQDHSDLCPFPQCGFMWDSGIPGQPRIASDTKEQLDHSSVVYQYSYKYKCTGRVTTPGDDKQRAFGNTRARAGVLIGLLGEERRPLGGDDVGAVLTLARTVFGASPPVRFEIAAEVGPGPLPLSSIGHE